MFILCTGVLNLRLDAVTLANSGGGGTACSVSNFNCCISARSDATFSASFAIPHLICRICRRVSERQLRNGQSVVSCKTISANAGKVYSSIEVVLNDLSRCKNRHFELHDFHFSQISHFRPITNPIQPT